ncbi:MAG: hypothetical protein RMN24_10380 [Anaerolineae bacterium]|nr:hypothetical protein [Anaerolineae bacterium]
MTTDVFELPHDPERLEIAYQTARKTGTVAVFAEALEADYARQPDNLLLAAWHYRLTYAAVEIKRRIIAWRWAIPLALLNGLLFWGLSDTERFSVSLEHPLESGARYAFLPYLVLLWAPLAAVFVLLFLVLAGGGRWRRAALAAALPLALAGYVLLVYAQAGPRVFQEQYLNLAALHLPLAAWAGVGLYLLWGRRRVADRFAFLLKSLEVFLLGGLMAAAGGVFTGISMGLFEALGITPPDIVLRLFLAGGGGLIPVLAVAVIYDPTASPAEQSFAEGLNRLIALIMRLLLPLALVVLLIYLGLIPFNFRQPFLNRDVLIIYNIMLFAVVALLVAATPMTAPDAPTARWLRRGLLALAGMTLLVGLYALAAILYRTSVDRLTPNRLTFIGWNLINIGILVGLLVMHRRRGAAGWPLSFQQTFAVAMIPYVLWALVVVSVIPWLFPIDRQAAASLPPAIRQIVYDRPYPILLLCPGSPHIYQLAGSEKRWIKDIPTFEAQGFRWDDVHKVDCADLRAIPDGLPIPPDAGPPPTP